jgi:DNA-binding NarL/FixJ family response regulator
MRKSNVRRVLLVEDDWVFLEAFERVFAALPSTWAIKAVQDGVSAFAALNESTHPFDLALIDIGLPDMSGLDVISKTHQKFPDMPILVVTVFNSEQTLSSAIRLGAHGYLLKGESEETLCTSIELVMRGEYTISPSLTKYLFKLVGAPVVETPAHNSVLTLRELELLQHIRLGRTYIQCADLMHISLHTVRSHIRRIYGKLEVSNNRQAISKAKLTGAFAL